MMQAASLLGAERALVGVSSGVARTLVALGVDLSGVRALRDLQDGVEYARGRVQGGIDRPRSAPR
jgi:rsbT co-antagonist protein RsbR